MADPKVSSLSSFVWSIAEILRGDFKQSEYGKVVLPFVVLRRLDCILEATKQAVLDAERALPDGVDDATRDMILFDTVGGNVKVYNLSRFSFDTLKGQDPGQLHENLIDYVTKFSPNVRDIFLDKFLFTDQLKRLKEGGILWNVFERFTQIDLHPDAVSNIEMGYLFEELIRRFSEISNETAGEHFTPREVIRLIVDLMIANDDAKLTGRGIIRQVYDPACGTGGMLALTEEALKEFNPSIRVELFGQELNGESYGICKSDMLVTGHDPDQIAFGNTLTQDAHGGKHFHYMLSNPPYGVDWKKYAERSRTRPPTMGHRRPLRRGAAAHLGRAVSVPAAYDLQDARRRGRVAHRHRHERLAALHRRGRFRRERDTPMDAGERLGRCDRRAADRPLLQHRHPDLRLAADQPQTRRAARQGAADRRQRRDVLEVDAQVARLEAARDTGRGARRDRSPLQCLH